MIYDMIIIGGGPAGVTVSIYGLRANQKVLLIEKEIIGGKVASSPLIENYPGIGKIKGIELSENFEQQVTNLGGEVIPKEVIAIQGKEKIKKVKTKDGIYEGQTIILALGTKYKKLGIENEDKLIGKGISFCAVCDGFFYKNKTVAVIGGGNTAIANALELANLCPKVYVLQKSDHLTAEPILINQLKEKKNVEILYDVSVRKFIGEQVLTGLEMERNEKKEILEVEGVFLAIGQIPETNFVKDSINMDEAGYILVDQDCRTNQTGIFAAGDCVSKKIRQLTTAVNDGTIASLSAIQYLEQYPKEE